MQFDDYIEAQRKAFRTFVDPFCREFEVAMERGAQFYDATFYYSSELPFPFELIQSELQRRFPQYEPRAIKRMYDPGETELHVETYTLRIYGSEIPK